jgi:hypothetical protein
MNILDKMAPAFMLMLPLEENVLFAEVGHSFEVSARVRMLVTDHSEDLKKGNAKEVGPVYGFVSSYYQTDIKKPLTAQINRFLANLDEYKYETDTLNATCEVENVRRTWIPNFGLSQPDPATFSQELSGFILEFDLRILGGNCSEV